MFTLIWNITCTNLWKWRFCKIRVNFHYFFIEFSYQFKISNKHSKIISWDLLGKLFISFFYSCLAVQLAFQWWLRACSSTTTEYQLQVATCFSQLRRFWEHELFRPKMRLRSYWKLNCLISLPESKSYIWICRFKLVLPDLLFLLRAF